MPSKPLGIFPMRKPLLGITESETITHTSKVWHPYEVPFSMATGSTGLNINPSNAIYAFLV